MFSCKLLRSVLGLWLFLSKTVSGNDSLGMKRLTQKDSYWQALHIKTGYEKFVPAGEPSPNSGDIMTRGVDIQLGHLVCGYIYSAHLHLHLTRTDLENTQQLKDHPVEYLEELSFRKQVRMMLTTMYNRNIERGMQELWLVFVYMQVLEEYVQSVRYQREVDDSISREMVSIHDAIMKRLTEYVKSYCTCESVFNYRFENSLFHKRDNGDDTEEGQKKEFNLIDDWVGLNKEMVENQILFNQKFQILTVGIGHFSYSQLSLNGITSAKHGYLKTLQDKIVVGLDWQNTFADITDHFNKVWSERWPDQRISRLVKFHKDLVSALKVFMLRCLWMHALYIIEMQNSVKNFVQLISGVYLASTYNKQVSIYLTEFMNHFDLTEDESFKNINNLLGSALKSVYATHNSTLVVEEIQKTLKAISAEFGYCDVTAPVEFDKQQLNDPVVQWYNTMVNNIEIGQPIDDLAYWMNVSSFRVRQFVKTTTRLLHEVDFRVIGSFNKASQNLEPLKTINDKKKSKIEKSLK